MGRDRRAFTVEYKQAAVRLLQDGVGRSRSTSMGGTIPFRRHSRLGYLSPVAFEHTRREAA